MTEEIVSFYPAPGHLWVLSGADNRILEELYTLLWNWLPNVANGASVSAFGQVLSSLEALMQGGTPPSPAEVETSLKVKGQNGIGVHVSLSPSMIEFSAHEYVWIGAQGYDHGSLLDNEGRPFNLMFTPEGSFDRPMFDRWARWAKAATDQQILGARSEAHASYYGGAS